MPPLQGGDRSDDRVRGLHPRLFTFNPAGIGAFPSVSIRVIRGFCSGIFQSSPNNTCTHSPLRWDGSAMAVNDLHAEFVGKLPEWQRAREVIAGEDAVKRRGDFYLSRLDSQSETEFAAYVKRAAFFNATGRTCSGLVGQIFRKAPAVKLPASGRLSAAMAAMAGDVDLCGRSLVGYGRDVVEEVVAVGRAGTLIDWDAAEGRA